MELEAVPGWMPIQFKLDLGPESAVYTCEVRHLGSRGIGVNFVDAAEAAPAVASSPDVIDSKQWLGGGHATAHDPSSTTRKRS